MKGFAVGLLFLVLVAGACSGDDAANAASLGSCESLAGEGISLMQDAIDLIDGLDSASFAALAEGAELPPEFAAVQTRAEEMIARADEIGCSDEDLAALLSERASSLSSDSVLGQIILEGVRAGESGDFLGDFFGG